jgi:hypothetical protein
MVKIKLKKKRKKEKEEKEKGKCSVCYACKYFLDAESRF